MGGEELQRCTWTVPIAWPDQDEKLSEEVSIFPLTKESLWNDGLRFTFYSLWDARTARSQIPMRLQLLAAESCFGNRIKWLYFPTISRLPCIGVAQIPDKAVRTISPLTEGHKLFCRKQQEFDAKTHCDEPSVATSCWPCQGSLGTCCEGVLPQAFDLDRESLLISQPCFFLQRAFPSLSSVMTNYFPCRRCCSASLVISQKGGYQLSFSAPILQPQLQL